MDRDHHDLEVGMDSSGSPGYPSSASAPSNVEMKTIHSPDNLSDISSDDSERQEALELAWKDITISYGGKKLISGVSGKVKGRFLAIMGGSGSGKTTLLNYLARRMQRQTKASEGHSAIQGSEYSGKTLKAVSGYVVQDDLLFGNLTVVETLLYAARLRLPAHFTEKERRARVDEVIDKLGLQHCRDTIIGDELKRGVSGGERKRVCVGIELLVRPNILMLDEPTSGLDSASALSLCETLKSLCTSGSCTVITTIHQPQTKIFNLFDDLILLNKGHVLYQGPANEVLDYYAEAGLPCPTYTNPADHILDVITYVPGCDEQKLLDNQSALAAMARRKRGLNMSRSGSKVIKHANPDKKKWDPPVVDRANWWDQFRVLTRRSFKENMRNRSQVGAQLLLSVIFAVLIGTVFLDIGDGQLSATKRQPVMFFCVINQGVFGALIVINSFPSERKIVLRERAAGTYFVSAYYMAKVVADALLQIVSPVIFSIIVYFLVGLRAEADKFFVFMAFMILCSLTATSIALFVSAVCRTTTLSVTILPAALEVSRLFGGYFLPPAKLPHYFSWLDALSYAKYTYVGISLNELTGLVLTCTDAEKTPQGQCKVATGEQTIVANGFDYISMSGCALVLMAMVIFYRILAYLAIRFIKW